MQRQSWWIMLGLCVVVAGLVLGLTAGTAMAQAKGEICDNGKDDDGDKLIDCADDECKNSKACTGEGCSPGFYKNHTEVWVGICCSDTSSPTCGQLLDRLTCKGSDASCGRSAAALFLDGCTGCTE